MTPGHKRSNVPLQNLLDNAKCIVKIYDLVCKWQEEEGANIHSQTLQNCSYGTFQKQTIGHVYLISNSKLIYWGFNVIFTPDVLMVGQCKYR